MKIPARFTRRLSPRGAGITALISGFLCLMYSTASGPDYRFFVSAALVLAVLHFRAAYLCILTGRQRVRWGLLVMVALVAIFSIDNVGRLLRLLGLPSFRLLI